MLSKSAYCAARLLPSRAAQRGVSITGWLYIQYSGERCSTLLGQQPGALYDGARLVHALVGGQPRGGEVCTPQLGSVTMKLSKLSWLSSQA